VTSLTVLVEGDDNPVKTLHEIHQPDNIETTRKGLLITEDPGSSQQFPVGSRIPTRRRRGSGTFRSRIRPAPRWWRRWTSPPTEGRPTSTEGRRGNLGAWESSGIVKASKAFGPGAFLINVQAHTLWIDKAPGEDNNGDGRPDFTYKREGGQLALIRIPGA
jgi:hypothetical protein